MAGDYPSTDFLISEQDDVRRVVYLPTGMEIVTIRLPRDPVAVPLAYTIEAEGFGNLHPQEVAQAALRQIWERRVRPNSHIVPTPADQRHGELTQRIFDALRERAEIASNDVAVIAMQDKGLDPEHDPVTRTDFVRRVKLQLNDMARKGKVERVGKGRALRWRLTVGEAIPISAERP